MNNSEWTDVISAPPAKLIQSKMNSRLINDLNEQLGELGKYEKPETDSFMTLN